VGAQRLYVASTSTFMGMMKNYLLKLQEQCSVQQFGQDAIEWAVISGWIKLTYHLDDDVRIIMDQYDNLIDAYRRRIADLEEQTLDAMQPLIAQIPGLGALASRQPVPVNDSELDEQLAVAGADRDDWRLDR
jgi:hypothetical protein